MHTMFPTFGFGCTEQEFGTMGHSRDVCDLQAATSHNVYDGIPDDTVRLVLQNNKGPIEKWIVVKYDLYQLRQTVERCWKTTSEGVGLEAELPRVGQRPKTRWEGPAELIATEEQKFELSAVTQQRWQSGGQAVVLGGEALEAPEI